MLECPQPLWLLGAYRPGAAYAKTGVDYRIEKCLPAGASSACPALAFRLLESVVNCYGKGWMGLFGQSVHRLCHAREEKALGIFLAPMTIRRSDQLLSLGYGER